MPINSRTLQIEQRAVTLPEAIQLGLAHHQAGRLAEAERIYQRVLAVDSGNPDALHLVGVIAHQLGKHELAVQVISRAIHSQSSNPYFLNNLGEAHRALRRLPEALASYDQALAIKPDHAEALVNRGLALHDLKRYDEALDSYDRAIAIRPGFAAALSNRSNPLRELHRYDDALASCNEAIALNPDFAEALVNRGLVLHALKRYGEAVASYDQAIAITPGFKEALSNRGDALQALKRYDEALASYDQALALGSDFAELHCNRSLVLYGLSRFEEALASYDRALKLEPDDPSVHFNRSMILLLTGDFARGWQEYEWRWKWKDFPSEPRAFAQPLWLGDGNLAGKTILLHFEQGIGDTIQFVRYAQAVAGHRARIVLEVQPVLKSLLSDNFGAHQVIGIGEPLPKFDFQCPLMSLPLAFETRLDSIPAAIPYLAAPAAAVRKWREILGPGNAPRVGIVWSGGPRHQNDQNRSIALSNLAGLADLGVTLVSLQNAVRVEDKGTLAANRKILHFGPKLADFSDTAALASLMDLVISVDTSVAHLAGALGKPVWILLPSIPDFRWLLDREDSPWYPSARLFRQARPGEWQDVIRAVKREIPRFLGLPDLGGRRA